MSNRNKWSNSVVLAFNLGAMIGFDLGKPVNKAALDGRNALLLEELSTSDYW